VTTVVPCTPVEHNRWVELMQPAIELAKAVAPTEFVPSALRGNPAAITAAILYGDEVGLGPMQALAKIAVIDGRPTLSAEAQRALILAAGHDLWIEESTNTRCVIGGRRRDSDASSRVTWTLDDAKRAGLAGRRNWRSYPRQMLLARASAELARAVFADAIGGLAATEELEGIVEDNGTPAEAEPPAEEPVPQRKTTRRRRQRTTPAAAPVATVSAPAQPAGPELPPLPDEQQPVEPAPVTDAQLKKLHAMFRDRGIEDRDARLDYCNGVIGRTVIGSRELTSDEASQIIDSLEQTEPESPKDPAGEQISGEMADVLRWMAREADVGDEWLRVRLAAVGMTDDGPVLDLLRGLTKLQASVIQSQLNEAIDAKRRAEEDDPTE
jgi:hypothetical protein